MADELIEIELFDLEIPTAKKMKLKQIYFLLHELGKHM